MSEVQTTNTVEKHLVKQKEAKEEEKGKDQHEEEYEEEYEDEEGHGTIEAEPHKQDNQQITKKVSADLAKETTRQTQNDK